MNAADFAAMSDPERNPKFSRRWEEVEGQANLPDRTQRQAAVAYSPLDALAVQVSEDWRSARVVRNIRPGNLG